MKTFHTDYLSYFSCQIYMY